MGDQVKGRWGRERVIAGIGGITSEELLEALVFEEVLKRAPHGTLAIDARKLGDSAHAHGPHDPGAVLAHG